MKRTPSADLDPEQFRQYACEAVNWIANYISHMDDYPVLARTKPGEVRAQLPELPPAEAEPFERIFADFEKVILPGITHWNHPRFFAYFSITGSFPGIIGELLSSALNVNAMLWKTSPSATELEEVVLDWLRQMLGLPVGFEGVINDTASVSSLCAIAAAREFSGLDIRRKGQSQLPPLRIYTSEDAHSSIEKAAIVLGIGQEGVRKIGTDSAFRMQVEELQSAIEQDIAADCKPICVIATLGTTSTTSIDPVDRIAPICRKYGLWLHVDAAYGGAAAVLPEMRPAFEGWEAADSIVVNPHKWLFTPIDCSVLYCRRPEILQQAFSLTPEYLKTSEAGQVRNLMDYGVSLGRRFRALKLWMIIRSLGRNQIVHVIREHIDYAGKLAKLIEEHPDFRLLAPVPFSTLVFHFKPSKFDGNIGLLNEMNEKILNAINETGKVFLSHTKVRGVFGLRLAIGNLRTSWDDIEFTWTLIRQKSSEILSFVDHE